jgi:hypothetical protein
MFFSNPYWPMMHQRLEAVPRIEHRLTRLVGKLIVDKVMLQDVVGNNRFESPHGN